MQSPGRQSGLSTKPVVFSTVGAACDTAEQADITEQAVTERTLRHNLTLLGVAALVVAIDQLSKWWALEDLEDRNIDLIWTLRLNLVHNSGAAFGLGQSLDTYIAILALLFVAGLFVVGIRWYKWSRWRVQVPPVLLGMILGGALGNLGDRFFRAGDGFLGGAVVDFIDLQWWPVFNVADAAIVIAAVVLVLTAGRQLGVADAEVMPEGEIPEGDSQEASR